MSNLPQKSNSVTATKGLLITKSSPLATESCKLEKQFITAQNMASHYRRVINAKPSIDTTPPKSLTKSIKAYLKAKDRVKRELMQLSWANKNFNRPKSAENPVSIEDDRSDSKSLTTVSRTLKTEESKSRTLPDQKKLHKSMSSIMNPALKAMSRLVSGHNYDVLDLHAGKFKHPNKEFQPRIINLEKSSSKLRQSNIYEPPRRRKKNTIQKTNNDHENENLSIRNSNLNESKNFNEESDGEELYPPKLNSSEIFNASTGSKRLSASQISLKRAAEKEEQLKYIEFLKDVTTDVLERGITSNKNRNRLDDRKMREILGSLRVDIGIPNESEAEIDSNLYQTVNKALLMDKEQNKENTDAESEYLSLKKFGYPSRVNSSRSLLGDERTDLNVSHGKKLFDDYENQIIQNIQTIRRKSSSSGNEQSRKNSVESDKSTPKLSRHSSILKKSPSQSSLPSRKESVDPKNQEVDLSKSYQDNEAHINDKNGDSDDDDIFITSKKDSRNSSNNGSRRSSQVKENSIRNSVVDEDALFNDNYGAPDMDSGGSENDDQFNELNTQMWKGASRKKSSDSSGSDNRSVDTPTPKPRSTKNVSNQKY
ncbi:spermatogenesis-associated 7 [Brachionus plicatilis]|uniref:Spermatogenesis-associated 7 n=1 Tax=Brachionus plicatilis TaxID=10195 RepID=A0A3M7S3C7_BRAPC|nr:spermatogenesis-associated 7 [Brachionus plicatilis]